MPTQNFIGPLQLGADSIFLTGADGGETVAIPTKLDGSIAQYIYVGADEPFAIRPVYAGDATGRGSCYSQSSFTPLIINVAGFTHLRVFKLGAHGPPDVYITPLENE